MSKSSVLCGYACWHLLNKFLAKMFIFCALICASKQTENYCKEENLFFWKIMLLLYSQFLKKLLKFAHFFIARCLDERFWDLLYFACLNSIQSIAIFRSSRPDVFLGRCSENVKQIYWRTRMLKSDFNKVSLQIYWNHTLALAFSCKFAAYFQNTFSKEHIWTAASVSSSQGGNVLI